MSETNYTIRGVAQEVYNRQDDLENGRGNYLPDCSTGRLQAQKYDTILQVLNVFKSITDDELKESLIAWAKDQTEIIEHAYYPIEWEKLHLLTEGYEDLHNELKESISNFRGYIDAVMTENVLSAEEIERKKKLLKTIRDNMGEFYEDRPSA